MIMAYIFFAFGLIFIIKGGDYFVDSATWMAKVTHIPEVLIGATIVSLATTFPEMMVSVLSVVENQPAMSIGNAIGSIICNTGLILGLYNLIKPSRINSKVFAVKGLLLLCYLFVFWFLARNNTIDTLSSLILLSLLVFYIVLNIAIVGYKKSKNQGTLRAAKVHPNELMLQIGKFILGITLIVFGSNLLVENGVTLAELWGVPAAVVSLTLIALGTSLPELVTAMTALLKGHAGLSIGNIIGANILNITMVIGISSQIKPLEITKLTLYLNIPAAIIINALLIIPSIISKKISRFQSVCIMFFYIVYITLLFYITYQP